jgi:hypothetical protein
MSDLITLGVINSIIRNGAAETTIP